MPKDTRKFRFKFKYVFLGLLLGYILMCQSCMTMRMSTKETTAYFNSANIAFQSKTVTISNHHLHYVETGNPQNPTLFFVHGSPGSWDAFKQYLTDTILLKKYRMIAIDRPGFGYSDFGNALDLADQSKIIEEFIAQIGNHKPIVLIGHSMGGPLIVKMAAEQPNEFQNLVILAGSIDPQLETAENWRVFLMSKPLRYLIPGALRPSNDELWWLKEDLYDMQPQLKNITAAVTIVHGTKDPLVPFGNVTYIRKKLVNAKSMAVIPIENANHFIPWEHYALIRDTLANLKLQ